VKTSLLRLLTAAAFALSAVACTAGSSAFLPQAPSHATHAQPQDVGGGVIPGGGDPGGTGP